jgi:hypothetical protein
LRGKLFNFLKGRPYHAGGLKKLVVRSCRVHEVGIRSWLGELVPRIEWDNVEAMGREYRGSDGRQDPDEFEDDSEDELKG